MCTHVLHAAGALDGKVGRKCKTVSGAMCISPESPLKTYIAGGPFKDRYGYYDDADDEDENEALIYFGAPLTGDGPYVQCPAQIPSPTTPWSAIQTNVSILID